MYYMLRNMCSILLCYQLSRHRLGSHQNKNQEMSLDRNTRVPGTFGSDKGLCKRSSLQQPLPSKQICKGNKYPLGMLEHSARERKRKQLTTPSRGPLMPVKEQTLVIAFGPCQWALSSDPACGGCFPVLSSKAKQSIHLLHSINVPPSLHSPRPFLKRK